MPASRSRPSRPEPLSPSERERFLLELVTFQLEELNGFGDQLAFALENGGPDPAAVERLAQRCRAVTEAVGLASDDVASVVSELLGARPPAPEDLFGPALVLVTLAGETLPVQALVAQMPESRRRALAAVRAACPV